MRFGIGRVRASPKPASKGPVVAVTGAAGRVGTACLNALADDSVIAIDRVRGRGPGDWRTADLHDRAQARAALAGATHLIHLAGHTEPDPERGSEILVDNVAIAASVLEAFAEGAPDTAVLASSISVYGAIWAATTISPDYVPVDELHPLRPSDPYSLSKVVVEALAAMWSRQGGFTTASMRFPWTAGDEPERIRDYFVALAADPMCDSGRRNLWAWIHVDDVAEAMVAALGIDDGRSHVLNLASPRIPGGHRASELMADGHPGTPVHADVDTVGLFATDRAQALLRWQAHRTFELVPESPAPPHPRPN